MADFDLSAPHFFTLRSVLEKGESAIVSMNRLAPSLDACLSCDKIIAGMPQTNVISFPKIMKIVK